MFGVSIAVVVVSAIFFFVEAVHTARDVLREKHPPERAASPDALVSTINPPPQVHPVYF